MNRYLVDMLQMQQDYERLRSSSGLGADEPSPTSGGMIQRMLDMEEIKAVSEARRAGAAAPLPW